jgi:hypothetical protein
MGEAHATKVVGDELEVPEVNSFAEGEPTACKMLTISYDGDCGCWNDQTSRGKAHWKSPFLARQLSVFFAPTRYRVVKITCFSFEVVL